MRSRAILAIVVVCIVVASGAFIALAPSSKKSDSGKVQVVASFYPLYYFASQIGGDRADVSSIMPDNVEPHSFDPKPSDIVRVSGADLLIFNGAGFEPWVDDMISQMQGAPIIVDTSANMVLLPSESVKAPYLLAADMAAGGNMSNLSLTSGPVSVSGDSALVSLELSSAGGAYNGVLRISIDEPGDYRFILVQNATIIVSDEGGTAIEPEMVMGQMADFPEFSSGYFMGFEEYPAQNYTIQITSSEPLVTMAIVKMPEEESGGHHHGMYDPHFWLDPLAAKIQVRNILSGFKAADPGNATYYQSNADVVLQRLDQLNLDFEIGLQNRTKNAIITTHEGFDYLAERYGFSAYGAIGISGENQPSIQDIMNLKELVTSLGLHYVYSEPVYSDAVISTIALETGATVLVLDGVHGRMGVHADMDYFQIMYENLEALRTGLEVGSQ